MSRSRTTDDAAQLSLFSVPDVVSMGDGSYRVVPRKPVMKCSVSDASRMTGVPRDTIYKLIAAEMIEIERPSPRKTVVILESLRTHMEASSKSDFWTAARRLKYFGKK